MWLGFIVAVLSGALLLCIPGYLAFSVFSISRISRIVLAPLFSVAAYCSFAVLFSATGLRSSAAVYFVLAVFVALILLLVSNLFGRTRGLNSACRIEGELPIFAIYLLVGVVVGGIAFATCCKDPGSIAETYDNVFHFSLLRSYVDTGDWSPFAASSYLGAIDDAPFSDKGYYPACWHIIASMIVDFSGVEVAISANATNYLFSSLVFPMGMFLLMSLLFRGDRRVIAAGAVALVGSVSYPWILLFVWPLYPNALSLALVPSALASFVMSVGTDRVIPMRAAGASAFVLSLYCSVYAQPNSVFTCAVFLIPFCIWRSIVAARSAEGRSSIARILRRMPFLAGFVFFAVAAFLWIAAYNAPFLQGVVQYHWDPVMTKMGAIASSLDLSFVESGSKPVLALLVIAGAIFSLCHRRYLWIVFAYAFACLIFILAASFNEEFIKHFFAGFWYTDPYRVAAMASIFAIPLSALGIEVLCRGSIRFFKRLSNETKVQFFERANCIAVLLVVVVCLLNPYSIPFVAASGISSFWSVMNTGMVMHDMEHAWVYDSEEMSFVEDVKSLVPKDALIINQPFDGSVFAYSVNGLNVYYRSVSGYGENRENESSKIIRHGLSSLQNDAVVRDAVEAIGAEYVLILDRDLGELEESYPTYVQGDWGGVDSITDVNPCFEVVLSRGEMVLYRIVS